MFSPDRCLLMDSTHVVKVTFIPLSKGHCDSFQHQDYSEARLCWPPLILFKAAQITQVANLKESSW
jgi:hypothetical protein